jgi:nicotinamidase-related amidase
MNRESHEARQVSRRTFVGGTAAAGLGLAAAASGIASAQSGSTRPSGQLNYVEEWLQRLGKPQLPVPGFEFEKGRTALLFTDPQNDFLRPDGAAWGAVGKSVTANNTVANMKALMKTAVETDTLIFISPHYYFPTDHGWKFEGTLEKLMHDIHMYDRPGALNLDGFEGSGADWLEEFKPYINHDRTIVCGTHKVYGPENNDVVLQLQKRRVEKVILGGMSANLCVESHLRELVERGFECCVAADATAAAQLPDLDGMEAALINYTMIASEVWTTKRAVEEMRKAS